MQNRRGDAYGTTIDLVLGSLLLLDGLRLKSVGGEVGDQNPVVCIVIPTLFVRMLSH
jgi:hypothetical protein